MGRDLNITLEHNGENPIRNDYICNIDGLNYLSLKDWDDLYDLDIYGHSPKKHSLKTLKLSKGYGTNSWKIDKIIPKIDMMNLPEASLEVSLSVA